MGNRTFHIAALGGAGWLLSLPFLAIGMGCFWLQRDSGGIVAVVLGVIAVLGLVTAMVAPGLMPWMLDAKRSVRGLPAAVGKSLLIAVVCLIAASLLSTVEALRPEDVSFFGYEFASSHALAAAVPTAAALSLVAFAAWQGGSDRRRMWIVPSVIVSVAGVGLWWWSAGTGYEAIRFTNADEIVLMSQTVALAGLLLACAVSAILFGSRSPLPGEGS